MKRVLAAILLLVYFTVSTGFAVSLHYCMDRLDSAELGASRADSCGKCGMHVEDSNGCCRDEVKVVKLSTDHFAAQVLASFASATAAMPVHTEYLILPFYNFSGIKETIAHSPPLPDKQDTYLQNCVFRL
jgi:hypothetical protein